MRKGPAPGDFSKHLLRKVAWCPLEGYCGRHHTGWSALQFSSDRVATPRKSANLPAHFGDFLLSLWYLYETI